jgi:hypothetical protein
VCHGTSAATAVRVLSDGVLLSKAKATGRDVDQLEAESTWGEPADYFEYVMLANGRCTAPEPVALSRELGRDLVPDDLSPGYPTAVRFYFEWASLAGSDNARFDGVHPVKIYGGLPLDHRLIAVVLDARHSKLFEQARNGPYGDRIVELEMPVGTRPLDWSSASCAAAALM